MRNGRVVKSLVFIFLIFISTQISIFGKEKWLEVRTKNFKLIGNTEEKHIKKVGVKLEQFREALKRLVPNLSADSPVSTTVIVFGDDKSFHPFKPLNANGKTTDWVVGYFLAGLDVNYIALSFNSKNQNAYQTIFHEYAHYLIDYNVGRLNVPPWYSEGLAEFYDKFDVENERIVKIGNENPAHLQILKREKLIPLDEFFQMDYETLRLQNQEDANLFYAQSWTLMHYLMRDETGKREAQLNDFIKRILQKEDLKTAFQASFQMSFEELELKLKTYLEIGKFSPFVTKFDEKLITETPTFSRFLTEAETEAHLGDLLYQRERFSEAEIHLNKSLRANQNQSFANSTLGLIKFKQQKSDEARKFLKNSIESKDASYLEFYRYAFFLSREVVSFGNIVTSYSDERTAEMRQALNKSIELNPKFVESYRLLAFINLVRNENLEEGIAHLKKAIEISPNKQIYQITLAEIYVRHKDFSNGKLIAEKVLNNPEESFIKDKAISILQKIAYIEEQMALSLKEAILTETKTETPNLRAKSRALTEEELEKNRLQTISEKISEVLRKPKKGEQRIVGNIQSIECVKGKIIFTIQMEDQTKKLRSDDFKKMLLWTYTAEMRGMSLSCGVDMKNIRAVLSYQPINEDEILGEIISIEFVPRDFELIEYE